VRKARTETKNEPKHSIFSLLIVHPHFFPQYNYFIHICKYLLKHFCNINFSPRNTLLKYFFLANCFKELLLCLFKKYFINITKISFEIQKDVLTDMFTALLRD